MERLQIALDVEGVLADSHRAAQEQSDMLDAETCPPNQWDFPTMEHYNEFMDVTEQCWRQNHDVIPPVEHGLGAATMKLSLFHDVDIVTHRTGVDEKMQAWLLDHGIEYRDFYATDRPKTHVGEYDVHIDDSPNVVDDVISDERHIFLVNRPYNEFVEPTMGVWKVSGVTEAMNALTDASIVNRVKSDA